MKILHRIKEGAKPPAPRFIIGYGWHERLSYMPDTRGEKIAKLFEVVVNMGRLNTVFSFQLANRKWKSRWREEQGSREVSIHKNIHSKL